MWAVVDIVDHAAFGPFESMKAAEAWAEAYDHFTYGGAEHGFGIFEVALKPPFSISMPVPAARDGE